MSDIIDKQFISIDKYHEINTTIIDNFCYFTIVKLDLENYKTLLLLLKDIILYLYLKNVKFIKQFIVQNDIPFFKKSTINDTDKTDDKINPVWITTNIEDFIEEICDALNIIHTI